MPKSRISNVGPAGRPRSKDGVEKNLWLSMLDSVGGEKRLPHKNLVVLGGTPESQKDFVSILASDAPKHQQDRRKRPPIANDFALGYTYQDVLDADQDDIMARLSIYLVSDPAPSYASLLKPLFTPQAIPETLLVILLDWSEPWNWARQLHLWVSMMLSLTRTMDAECEAVADQVMKEWQQRKRGISSFDGSAGTVGQDSNVILPLGQGEWDIPLGLPLCVVCQNTDRIGSLEVEQNWREEDFDFVLQYLRTVLLKHGASLVYTSSSLANSLPTVIHSTLGIHSLLKKQTLRHNVLDRDKILVPPNWDSFGKIRVIREGFDVEKVSASWASGLDVKIGEVSTAANQDAAIDGKREDLEALQLYESVINVPYQDRTTNSTSLKPGIEVVTPTNQEFLASQMEVIERLKSEEEKTSGPRSTVGGYEHTSANDRMNDQIGPVQVNMGGIQVDADDMLRKLRSSHRDHTSGARRADSNNDLAPASTAATPEREMKAQNENLHNFFAGLMKRGASGSPRNTPGTEGKKAAAPRETSKEEEGGKRLFAKE